MVTELHAVISGKVQGVGYRDFVRAKAEELGIVGFIKNRTDNAVELVAQGYPDELRALQERLQEGSVLAQVVSVAVSIRTPSILYDNFSVKV